MVKEFLVNCSIEDYSSRTIKSYRNNLSLFMEHIQKQSVYEIEQITPAVIRIFIQDMLSTNHKSSYVNNHIKTLRSFFRYILEQEYIVKNPMDKVKWCKESITLIKPFRDEEVARMLMVFSEKDYLNIRNKLILYMLLDTGIRCNELCEIKENCIGDNYFTIIGKGNKERIVPISPKLHRLICKYSKVKVDMFIGKSIHTDTYFLSRTGRKLTNAAVERVIRFAGCEAKIDDSIRCSPHTCRHWYAQTQIKNGCDIYTLSRLLGHTNIKITQVYLNSMQDNDIVDKAIKTSPLMNLVF